MTFSSLYKICSKFTWLKSEIYLLLSNFFQSYLRILDFVAGIFEEKSGKKYYQSLQINIGKNIKCNKKLELRVKSFIKSEVPHCKSILKSPTF